ncbi:MAG TPA: hypothetical protein PKV86_06960, partial [Syntrophobacteraceae bacterium]|nr:hypothetical protein [Syntrophobacteraceae bacterium]
QAEDHGDSHKREDVVFPGTIWVLALLVERPESPSGLLFNHRSSAVAAKPVAWITSLFTDGTFHFASIPEEAGSEPVSR